MVVRRLVIAGLLGVLMSMYAFVGAASASNLVCGTISYKNRTFSSAYIVHSCNGSGQIVYTVHCQPFADVQVAQAVYAPGMSIYRKVTCPGATGTNYLSSVSYKIS